LKPTHCEVTGEKLTEKNSIWNLVGKRIVVDVKIEKVVTEYRIWGVEYK
jgi:hypothetical protein